MEVNGTQTTQQTRFIQATCTKCGAALEVDPSQDAAICPYCDTPYVVEKAIQQYNIKNAHIDHVDHVTVDMKGSVDSFLGFASRQMDKAREDSRERRRQSFMNDKNFFKYFFMMFGGLTAMMTVMWFVMNVAGLWA